MSTKLKILILEDFPPDVELIKRELKKSGFNFTVVRVDNQKDFINQILEFSPDLIISDYSLPQYDGISAINDLRRINPTIPLIIVTGSLDEETAADTIKAGAWDYVVKERLYRLPTAIRQTLELKNQITSRLKAEDALHQTEDEFETLRNNVPLALYRSTTEGKLLYANPAFIKMFGFENNEEALNTPIAEHYVKPEERVTLLGLLQKNKIVKDYHILCKHKDGRQFWGSFNIQAIFNDKGEHIFQDGIISDITEIKRIYQELIEAKETAEQADKLKTAFLANMSHEIRTPMNSIIGFSDLLGDSDLSRQEITDFVQHIQRNSEILLKIISDIIDIAKIESGILTVEKSICDLNEIFAGLSVNFKHYPQDKKNKVKFIVSTPVNDKLLVETDQERIKQILSNLLTNAFKFTERGIVELGYVVKDTEIEIYVKDTGLGIPDEKKEIIFERFRQVDDSHTREFGGTGLGLTIAKSLVEKLGGTIGLNSTLYKGSTFFFTIPYDKTKSFSKPLPILKTEPDKISGVFEDKKILIAEDVDSNYIYLETVLKNSGAKLIRAKDGIEAVESCRQSSDIDLVLMDIQMPNMNGFDATLTIRKFNKAIPIIGQTAYALSSDRNKVLEAGCNDYLVKPISKEQLFDCLAKYLG